MVQYWFYYDTGFQPVIPHPLKHLSKEFSTTVSFFMLFCSWESFLWMDPEWSERFMQHIPTKLSSHWFFVTASSLPTEKGMLTQLVKNKTKTQKAPPKQTAPPNLWDPCMQMGFRYQEYLHTSKIFTQDMSPGFSFSCQVLVIPHNWAFFCLDCSTHAVNILLGMISNN